MAEHCTHDHGRSAPGDLAVRRIIARAEAGCLADGERMTAPRRRALELLLEAAEPVKAYDLIARFGADGQAAKPPTVYRALEFLERRGLVHRIASISAYVACSAGHDDGGDHGAQDGARDGAGPHTAAFLICDCCGAAREIDTSGIAPLQQAALAAGYSLSRATIEGHGLCDACRVDG
jgi:Fur family zinc uptake transcriptional regulator